MKVFLVQVAAILLFSLPCYSQGNATDKDKDAVYNKMIDTRAQKIVTTLSIPDSAKSTLLKDIIATQYKNLNSIYASRDLQIKTIKEKQANGNKDSLNTAIDKIKEGTVAQIAVLHKNFISQLSNKLIPTQVDQVKNGMTYNVLNVTYNGYNQMIRTLTDPQKKQIMAWLTEAREQAMDAESSEKKHGVFGKYKGRINNYLSAAGYNLKKEGDDWEKRIKEEAASKKKAQ